VRLCLHDTTDASFHERIILQHRANYYRPHKHPEKGVSYHIIEGSMGVLVFDENGNVTDAQVLEPHNSFLYRVGPDVYRVTIPLSDLVIYQESKVGPFLRDENVFPLWAPHEDNPEEAQEYKRTLLRELSYS